MRYLFLLFAAASFPIAGLHSVTSHVFGGYKYPPLPCEGPESAGSSEPLERFDRTIPSLGGSWVSVIQRPGVELRGQA